MESKKIYPQLNHPANNFFFILCIINHIIQLYRLFMLRTYLFGVSIIFFNNSSYCSFLISAIPGKSCKNLSLSKLIAIPLFFPYPLHISNESSAFEKLKENTSLLDIGKSPSETELFKLLLTFKNNCFSNSSVLHSINLFNIFHKNLKSKHVSSTSEIIIKSNIFYNISSRQSIIALQYGT